MVTVGLLATLEAKPGKEQEVADFLTGALPIVEGEPVTTAWFAIKMGPSTFGIFDVFPDETGRQPHLNGSVATALMVRADEPFALPPKIEMLDVLASRLRGDRQDPLIHQYWRRSPGSAPWCLPA